MGQNRNMTDTAATARRIFTAVMASEVKEAFTRIVRQIRRKLGEDALSEEELLELLREVNDEAYGLIDHELVSRLEAAHFKRTGRETHRYGRRDPVEDYDPGRRYHC